MDVYKYYLKDKRQTWGPLVIVPSIHGLEPAASIHSSLRPGILKSRRR